MQKNTVKKYFVVYSSEMIGLFSKRQTANGFRQCLDRSRMKTFDDYESAFTHAKRIYKRKHRFGFFNEPSIPLNHLIRY